MQSKCEFTKFRTGSGEGIDSEYPIAGFLAAQSNPEGSNIKDDIGIKNADIKNLVTKKRKDLEDINERMIQNRTYIEEAIETVSPDIDAIEALLQTIRP